MWCLSFLNQLLICYLFYLLGFCIKVHRDVKWEIVWKATGSRKIMITPRQPWNLQPPNLPLNSYENLPDDLDIFSLLISSTCLDAEVGGVHNHLLQYHLQSKLIQTFQLWNSLNKAVVPVTTHNKNSYYKNSIKNAIGSSYCFWKCELWVGNFYERAVKASLHFGMHLHII